MDVIDETATPGGENTSSQPSLYLQLYTRHLETDRKFTHVIKIRHLRLLEGLSQGNHRSVYVQGHCYCTAAVPFTLPFWKSHGRILLSRDTFEQIIGERGVSWLSCFYWQLVSAASDSRDSSALSSSPTARTRLSPARIQSATSRRTTRERVGGRNKALRSRKCFGTVSALASVW